MTMTTISNKKTLIEINKIIITLLLRLRLFPHLQVGISENQKVLSTLHSTLLALLSSLSDSVLTQTSKNRIRIHFH